MNRTLTRLKPLLNSMSSTSRDSLLKAFSTCEISDALIKLKVPHGGHIPDIHIVSPATSNSEIRICSPAYTVKMVLASDVTAPKLSSHFVDTAPAGSVVVVDAPSEAKSAVWGGLMTAGAQARGATGVIISGRCRDLSEHRALGFPVFSRGHSTLGQSPFTRPSAVNVPLTIFPQGSGADTFPAVIELATKGREIDAQCMEDIKAGKGIQNSFKLHRGK
ncbi:ribonuclease E inhibitor RraA/Dimethylmenaquinone methyltransferase [Flammula alnicola]|nr:ribonuclease E inhibitor RraA/Dimethylmenaquinone methyltransferase [Flammula alnicola]